MTKQMRNLREHHPVRCACSICDELKHAGHRSFGLLAPIEKSWNSWWWFFFVRRDGSISYVRTSGLFGLVKRRASQESGS